MATRNLAAAPIALGMAAALSGCGPASDGIDREPVSGSITLDGQPLGAGSITFVPLGPGPTAGGTIVDGAYTIPRPAGPSPGGYRVEILSFRPTGRAVTDPSGPKGSTVEESKNVVPDRYGLKSGLKADVKKGGSNTFPFDLDSTPDKPEVKRRR